MDQGPFERVERIKRVLVDELLPGLIAVFSKASSDDLLLVYLDQALGAQPPQRLAITVAELPDVNLMEYDGPTIGHASIDLLRPDVATKGQRFLRLDRILRRNNNIELLRQTWADLAGYLQAKLSAAMPADDERNRRAVAELAAISAPHKIERLPHARRRGMVAFIPARSEAVCLGDMPLEALHTLPLRPGETVIALEEVRPFIEASHERGTRDPYPIELRTILRRTQLEDQLGDTLRDLARAFHRRWETTGDRDDCERAYATAMEGRLAHNDVDDLIAVIPDPDFDQFVTSGAGTYVYRRPLEVDNDHPDAGIRSRYLADAITALERPGGPAVFSLLPLRGLCTGSGSHHWFDLGPPLRKSARTEILARNAWLLVQDLLDASRDERTRLRVAPESLFQTMTHCCAIFSLTDPWRTRQGRRNEWLQESYRTLGHVIDLLHRKSPTRGLASYYLALGYWYGCALNDEAQVVESLDRMVEELTARPGDARFREEPEVTRMDVQRLKNVGTALGELLRGGGRAEAYEDLKRPAAESIPQVVRRATDMAEPLDLLSVPFGTAFREYANLDEEILRVRGAQIPVRDKIDRLRDCLGRLRYGRRLIFAPEHQARVLGALYGRAIRDTQELVTRLVGGAALDIRLKTSSILPDQEENGVILSVTNVGSVEAQDVELELGVSDAFELLDLSFKQTLLRLAPEAEHPFRFGIRSMSGAETFPIRCAVAWSDRRGQRQQRTLEFLMRIAGVESGSFQQVSNPYVFGAHVEDYRYFYGRRGELERVLGHLANRRPQNVLLRAPRRAGKTSLLYMIRAVLADLDGRHGVREWFDLPSAWGAALNAGVPVILNLQGDYLLQRQPTPSLFYRAVLEALHDAGLRSSASELLLDEPTLTYTQFKRALDDIVRDAGGLRPVMLVDEFDVLDQMEEKSSFYGALRTVITTVQGVTWVVASALGLYNEVRNYASPLFNVFKIIPMNRLDPAAARHLVLSPWTHGDTEQGGSTLHIAEDAVETIIEEAGSYPYFIQMLCSEIVDHVNALRTNLVRYQTVIQVIDRRMLAEEGAADQHFAFMWDRAGTVGRLVLLTLLHSPVAMGREELEESAVRLLRSHAGGGVADALLERLGSALEALTMMDAVRTVHGGAHAFGVPLFRRLLLRRVERANLERDAVEALVAETEVGTHA